MPLLFVNLPKPTEVSLIHSNLNELPSEWFGINSTAVERIDFGENNLQELPRDTFKSLVKLEELFWKSNLIQRLDRK